MTPSAIAKYLTTQKILSPGGKNKWAYSTVKNILSNEKYKGDALLQKKYTLDFLSKKQKVNNGEIPQYYVENSHKPIIEPCEFDAVQMKIERRKKIGRPTGCNSPFSAKIVCESCGGYFGSKVWNSTDKYRRVIWRCNEKYKNETPCKTPHVDENTVKQKFLEAFNKLMGNRDELIKDCRTAQRLLSDYTGIDKELEKLKKEIEVVTELAQKGNTRSF